MSTVSVQHVRPTRRIGAWALQGVLAAAFLAAGSAKLAGVPFMVELFDQIGVGQWFRVVTGVVEVVGAEGVSVGGTHAAVSTATPTSTAKVRQRPRMIAPTVRVRAAVRVAPRGRG